MNDISGMKRVHTNIDLMMDEKGVKNDGELASALGWSKSSFSQRLSGKLTMDTLEAIAKYFGVSVKELLR